MLRTFHTAPLAVLVAALVGCGSSSSRPELDMLQHPSRDEIVADLQGQSFDDFVERSFRALLRRSPEDLSALGIASEFGLRDRYLNDISLEFVRETAAIQGDILDLLEDYEGLSAQQSVVADTYRWWLEDQRRLADFAEHTYLLQPSFRGTHGGLEFLLTGVHRLQSEAGARDYVERLWRIETSIDQAITRIASARDAGITPPQRMVDQTIAQLDVFLTRSPRSTTYYSRFESALEERDLVDRDLLRDAETAIAQSVIPAYERLLAAANGIRNLAPRGIGVHQHPNGDAYYAAALRHHSTSDLTPDQVAALGRAELVQINALMRERFEALGYNLEASLASNYARAESDSGLIPSRDVRSTFLALIDDALERSRDLFVDLPQDQVDVITDPNGGGYYLGPSLDGSRDGAFYAFAGSQPYLTMPTLAYHEAIPGHHLQIALASELEQVALFQRIAGFTGYIEGWGLYAETVAFENGWFDDVFGELGYLQFQAFRAARLVIDSGIHTGSMSYNEAVSFFQQNVGFSAATARGQVGRYMSWPGQATAYYIGQLELLDLRAQEQNRLGTEFDLREFHSVVLQQGALPLEVLRARFAL